MGQAMKNKAGRTETSKPTQGEKIDAMCEEQLRDIVGLKEKHDLVLPTGDAGSQGDSSVCC